MNEWYVSNGDQAAYQQYGNAQLDVYNEASFGWSYWTIKNARKHWDFEWNILNKYLLFGKRIPFYCHAKSHYLLHLPLCSGTNEVDQFLFISMLKV